MDFKTFDKKVEPTFKRMSNVFLFKSETYSNARFFYEFGWNTLV